MSKKAVFPAAYAVFGSTNLPEIHAKFEEGDFSDVPKLFSGFDKGKVSATAKSLKTEDKDWFETFAQKFIEYRWANDPKLKRKMKGDARDYLYQMVAHWYTAFLSHPVGFKATHPLCALESFNPVWTN